ncbi:MAG: hypothetical protein IT369_10215, partial [Candidatus Latescibacteria bacterium]|nr:hypothetical protein [Candidatus Latescibacterota bacterium]
MRPWLVWLWCCCQACFWPGTKTPPPVLQSSVAALVAAVAPAGREMALPGLRDENGKRSALTRLLDEELAGALVRSGAAFELVEGDEQWNPPEEVPERYLQQVSAPVWLVGQVLRDSTSVYLRLQALERPGTRVLAARTLRLAGELLERRLETAPAEPAGLGVQLQ